MSIPLAPAGDAALLVQSPEARGASRLRARLLAEYASEPLVLISPSQQSYQVVRDQLLVHAQLSFSLRHRFLFDLDVPYAARVQGETPPTDLPSQSLYESVPLPAETRAWGAISVGARARLLGGAAGPAWGLGARVLLPGSSESYTGDSRPELHVFTSTGFQDKRAAWAVELGYALRRGRTLPGVLPTRVGSSAHAGVMARFAIDPKARIWIGPELRGSFVTAQGASWFDPRSTTVQLLLGARVRPFGDALELGGGFGPGLGQGVGSADYRAFLFVGWSTEEPPPPPDRDEDGVADAQDVCLNLFGQPSRDPLMNGCPALPLDTDSDSIPDVFDACPREAGVASAQRSTHGCPASLDPDQDGILSARDACPERAGIASADPAQNGCPATQAPPRAQLLDRSIVISEQVQFETGTARLRAESAAILTEVLEILKAHSEIQQVEVQGHTDDTGNAELNLRLSEARARSVAGWLAEHGIATSRLSPKGYGQTRPLGDNASEAGRARNRRVEFRILTRGEVHEP
ncbi:MAG TPA: OmpA family protein [Polyangiaceae bacterium]|nr:OmpA family protein [Polyangiaceae bacterium]